MNGPAKFAASLVLTAIVSAYVGFAVPRWLEGEKIVQYERGFTNMTLPKKLRYSAEGSRFPYIYSSEIRLENVGDVDLTNEALSLRLAPSSMDCGMMKPEERRVRAYEATSQGMFDADFDNFISTDDNQNLTIQLANLPVGEHKTFLLFSNFAFRTVMRPKDEKLTLKTIVPKRPDRSFADDPEKLFNCRELIEEVARRQGMKFPPRRLFTQ